MNTKLLKTCLLLVFIGILSSCSNDDNITEEETGILAEVPSGEIVPTELREETLVGFNFSSERMSNQNQIWWKHGITQQTYDCPSFNEEVATNTIVDSGYYYAFKPDGYIYYKNGLDGQEMQHHSWQWNSDMSGVIINGLTTFYFNELNPTNVVYYSVQGPEDCQYLSWELFTTDY